MSIVSDAQIYRYNLKFNFSEKHFTDTIPIEFDHDQLFLPVEIDGQRLRFKLDTGSSTTVIYDDSPIRAIRELGQIQSTDATGVRYPVRVVALPPLHLGHLTVNGYSACVHRRMVRRRHEDGILGFDLFNKGLAAKIDTRKGVMIITDQKKQMKAEQGEALRYKLRSFVPYVQVSPLGGLTEEVLFDTGSRELYAMNKQRFDAWEREGANISPLVEGRGQGSIAIGHFGTERTGEVVLLALPSLCLGNFELRDIHCQTFQGSSHIGAPLLKYGTLVINPFNKQLLFQPFDQQDFCIVNNPQFEIAIVPTWDGRPSVGLVWERSEAYQQGFRQGDIIEQVDGEPAGDFQSFIRRSYIIDHIYTFTLRDSRGFQKEVRGPMPLLRRR